MVRRFGILLIFSTMLGAWALFPVAHRVGAQEDVIVLKHKDVYKKRQRPSVQFSHEKHAELYSDCVVCHHIYEYKNGVRKNVWDGDGQSCSECHKAGKVENKPALRDAFHENCTGCHRKLIKEESKSGPETCGECHIRKSKDSAHP